MKPDRIIQDAENHHLAGELIEAIRKWMEDAAVVDNLLIVDKIAPVRWNSLVNEISRRLSNAN